MRAEGVETTTVRVALLTPYDGGNLGDCAIQEAIIANLRRYDPKIDVCGITLDPGRTSAQHQIPCYPLTRLSQSHCYGKGEGADAPAGLYRWLRRAARAVPFARWAKILFDEIAHVIQSYRLLRKVDVIVVAGGGQLDDEWGGSWGHPYALMKWALLARTVGSSVVFLSVGACRIESRLTRLFLRIALSLACYRSYRDAESRRLALGITPRADGEVVPDLAYSLPLTHRDKAFRVANTPLVVGVSPIAYCHPELWPTKDQAQYQRYITELASFVSSIVRSGSSVCLFSSSPPDDQLFADIFYRLDPGLEPAARARLHSSAANTLGELLNVLCSVDIVVASRLHGLLLSFLSGKPSLAISYDRKVKCLMDELGQSAYCVDIRSLKCGDLLRLFAMLEANRETVLPAVAATCREYASALQQQYRALTQLFAGRPVDPLQSPAQAFSESKP